MEPNESDGNEPAPDYDIVAEEGKVEADDTVEDRDDMVNPTWCEDTDLGEGDLGELSQSEVKITWYCMGNRSRPRFALSVYKSCV